MKILGINSSPRGTQSHTLKLIEAVFDGSHQRGAETEVVDICKLDIQYCRACGACYAKGTCIQKDDFPDLFNKMLCADGIVIGSPVYLNNISAQLKAVFDRMSDAVHCQMLSGKYGCAVSTTSSSGVTDVLSYINYILNRLGVLTVGEVGVAMFSHRGALDSGLSDAASLGQTLAEAIATQRLYPEQERALAESRERFKMVVQINKDIWPHEYEWWAEKGWI
jgi:multimeric flavodoxin WrbA